MQKVETSIEGDLKDDVEQEEEADKTFKKVASLKDEEKKTTAAMLAKLEQDMRSESCSLSMSFQN